MHQTAKLPANAAMEPSPQALGCLLALFIGCFTSPASDLGDLTAQAANFQTGQSLAPLRTLEAKVREAVAKPAQRSEVEAALIQLLNEESTYEAKLFACRQLAFVASEKSLPALSSLLRKPDTVGIACMAIATLPPGKADEVLREGLTATQGNGKAQIIATLGNRRDRKALKEVAAAARDADLSVASAALSALGEIGTPSAADCLSQLAADTTGTLKSTVTQAELVCADLMAREGSRKQAKRIYESLLVGPQPTWVRRSALAGRLGVENDAEGLTLEVLRGSDSALKPVAIAAAPSLKQGSKTSRALASSVSFLTEQERTWLVDSMAARPDVDARAFVVSQLGCSADSVRLAAITTLGRSGDARTVSPLALRLANCSENEERRAIESALVALPRDLATSQAIRSALANVAGQPRATLVTALSRREGAGANPILLTEAANPDPTVSRAAYRGLARTAGQAEAPAMLALLAVSAAQVRTEAESATAQALLRMSNGSERSSLVRLQLQTAKDTEVRAGLVSLLPLGGDGAALQSLKACLVETDPVLRGVAIRALAEWPDPSAWSSLLQACNTSADLVLRSVALRGLVRLANTQPADLTVVDRYKQLLHTTRNDSELKLVLGGLGAARHPAALELALPYLDRSSVRAEAAVAIRAIANALKTSDPEAVDAALSKLGTGT